MKTTVLPENILRRMEPKERAKLGKAGKTAAECSDIVLAKLERQVHLEISNWLRLKGIFYVHSRTDRKTTNAVGCPDFVFAWAGEYQGYAPARPTAVEVKVGNNVMSDEQLKVMAIMQGNGWAYHIVSSLPEMLVYLGVAPQP